VHDSFSQLGPSHGLKAFSFELDQSASLKLLKRLGLVFEVHRSAETEGRDFTLDLLDSLLVPFPLHFGHDAHRLDLTNFALVAEDVVCTRAVHKLLRYTIGEHLDSFFGFFL